jgi:hypothetical protein
MNYKIVYQTDVDGIYVGEEKAYESPLEPGVFLIPNRAVEIQPPTIDEGNVAKWDGDNWNIVSSSSVTTSIPQIYPIPASITTWDDIRLNRNTLLAASDWVGLKDVNLANEQAWLVYRQALRDITKTFSKPEDVVWPVKP